MGSDELPTGGPEFGGGEVDFARYMFGILVVLRFLMRGSMTLSEYLAGLEIFLLGRESSTAGSDSGSGSLGRTFSFKRVGGRCCRGMATLMVSCEAGEASPEAACLLGMWSGGQECIGYSVL